MAGYDTPLDGVAYTKALEQRVADLAALLARKDRASGTDTATWTASITSAQRTIPHGLEVAPTGVSLVSYVAGADFRLVGADATNIVVEGFYTALTPISGSVGFGWTAFR